FALLRPGALTERPIPHRHRLIFYLGHLEAFDWNLVARAGFAIPPFREAFDRLFAFGIDPGEAGLPAEPASAWPAESAVRDYNARVRETVDRCLKAADFGDPRRDAARMFHVAIEHRLMHAETLAYAIHRLPLESKLPPSEPSAEPPERERSPDVSHPSPPA